MPDKSLKARGRSLDEFMPLNPAEEILRDACCNGTTARIGDECPAEKTPENLVRAEFLRFVALGGDERTPVHEQGIRLRGAWVAGRLDVMGAHIPQTLLLQKCHFDTAPVFIDASIKGSLSLPGSRLYGFVGDRMTCSGSIIFRNEFASAGNVRLLGAQISSNVDCSTAQFDGKGDNALSMDGANIEGSIFLNDNFSAAGEVTLLGTRISGNLTCGNAQFDGQNGDALSMDGADIKGSLRLGDGFTANGEVRLLGANIGGSLECNNAKFDGKGDHALSLDRTNIKGNVFISDNFFANGTVRLNGTKIGGNLECKDAQFNSINDYALLIEGADIKGSLFLKNPKEPIRGVSLASTHIGQLVDDMDSWGDDLILDGFVYDTIGGGAPTDAVTRLNWLKKQRKSHYGQKGNNGSFRPQPWQQLIKVFRTMGHTEDARQVAIAREEHLRAIGKIGEAPAVWPKWRRLIYQSLSRGLHWTFGKLIGYGYRPLRMVLLMILVWLACGAFFLYAAKEGVMAPSNPLVFDHPRYEHCRPDYIPGLGQAPARPKVGNWYVCPELSGEYTTFSPMVYSLDLILPLVDLQQDRDWAPIIPTPKEKWHEELGHLTVNHLTRFAVWLEILFGWVASLLLVAVLSGLTQRDRD